MGHPEVLLRVPVLGLRINWKRCWTPKRVLLVDDDQAQVGEVYFVFDEGVGADGQVDLAAEDAGAGCLAWSCRRGSR